MGSRMKSIALKTWPREFQAVFDGRKAFDVRPNDRGFEVGDQVVLREWVPEDLAINDPVSGERLPQGYTGRVCTATITFILAGPKWGIDAEHCVLSLANVNGSMNPIILPVTEVREARRLSELQGLTQVKEDIRNCSMNRYFFPEFGASRFYFPANERQASNQIVIPLGGLRYRVIFQMDACDQDVPTGGELTLIPTNEPETPYSSERNGRTPRVSAFGQPRFIQSPVFPSLDGKCAGNLLTLETGWGDAGNVNIFLALDANGIPAKAWLEASCC
jgi:Domain of unknown function (DUF3850)